MGHGVLRFITAGSVDDGKSTLIGRLLFDTKAVLADQLATLSKARHARVTAEDARFDLALLTDGLEAEREQGITIDVAYRYFATAQRKFIVADAPGHEQYTRNLVTGASQADVAVLIVDATRVDLSTAPATLLPQTKRHAAIVKLLGLRHVGVVVNKMDLVGYGAGVFSQIVVAVEGLCATLGLPAPRVIPVSALQGDNVVRSTERMPWYSGPTLLAWLEALDTATNVSAAPGALRLPVQLVARQDGAAADDFRGYLGRVEAGAIRRGQTVRVLPSGQSATVAEVHVANDHTRPLRAGSVDDARAGHVVAVSLVEDVDVSRGDMLVSGAEDAAAPSVAKSLRADLCWLDAEPLSTARKYVLRHTTNAVFARVKSVDEVLDVKTLSHGTGEASMKMNDIGRVQLALQKPIVCDPYDRAPATGAFVLIDEATNATVAAGMVRTVEG